MNELGDRPGSELRPGAGAERELKAVLGDLFEHSETLVRQEIALGKAELDTRMEKAKTALMRGVISAGLYHAAYLTTLATLVLLLAQWVAPWAAALIIALAASAGAVVFTLLGRQALHEVKDPPETRPAMRSNRMRSDTAQRAHT